MGHFQLDNSEQYAHEAAMGMQQQWAVHPSGQGYYNVMADAYPGHEMAGQGGALQAGDGSQVDHMRAEAEAEIPLTPELAERLEELKFQNKQLTEAEAQAAAMQIPLRLHIGTVVGTIVRLQQAHLEAEVLNTLKWLDERGAAAAIADEDDEAITLKVEGELGTNPDIVQALRDQKQMRVALKHLHEAAEGIEMSSRTSEAIQRDLILLHRRLELNINGIEQQMVAVVAQLGVVMPTRDQLARELEQYQNEIRGLALFAARQAAGAAETDSLEQALSEPINRLMREIRESRLAAGATEDDLARTELQDREECILRIGLSEAEKNRDLWATIERLAHMRSTTEVRFREISEYAEELRSHQQRLDAEHAQLKEHLAQVSARLQIFLEFTQGIAATKSDVPIDSLVALAQSKHVPGLSIPPALCTAIPTYEVHPLSKSEFEAQAQERHDAGDASSSPPHENPNSGILLASLYVHSRPDSDVASAMAKNNDLILHKLVPTVVPKRRPMDIEPSKMLDFHKKAYLGLTLSEEEQAAGVMIVDSEPQAVIKVPARKPAVLNPIRVTPRRINVAPPEDTPQPSVQADDGQQPDVTNAAEALEPHAMAAGPVQIAFAPAVEQSATQISSSDAIKLEEEEKHIASDLPTADNIMTSGECSKPNSAEPATRNISDFASPMSIDSLPVRSTGAESVNESIQVKQEEIRIPPLPEAKLEDSERFAMKHQESDESVETAPTNLV